VGAGGAAGFGDVGFEPDARGAAGVLVTLAGADGDGTTGLVAPVVPRFAALGAGLGAVEAPALAGVAVRGVVVAVGADAAGDGKDVGEPCLKGAVPRLLEVPLSSSTAATTPAVTIAPPTASSLTLRGAGCDGSREGRVTGGLSGRGTGVSGRATAAKPAVSEIGARAPGCAVSDSAATVPAPASVAMNARSARRTLSSVAWQRRQEPRWASSLWPSPGWSSWLALAVRRARVRAHVSSRSGLDRSCPFPVPSCAWSATVVRVMRSSSSSTASGEPAVLKR